MALTLKHKTVQKQCVYIYCVYAQDVVLVVFSSRCGGLEFNMISISMLFGDNLINLVKSFFWLSLLRMVCWYNQIKCFFLYLKMKKTVEGLLD